ncbi:MAG: PEGA domain-containing protein [Archangium sp.]
MKRLVSMLLVAALPALAQDFEGLDLSGEEKTPVVAKEYRPSLAIISVKAVDKENVSASRARQLEAEFTKQLAQGDLFQVVLEPSTVRSMLGAEFAQADACVDYACFDSLAKKLKVNRIVRLTVAKHNAGSMVEMYGFDPGFNEVLHVGQDSNEKAEKTFLGVAGKSQATKDKEFIKSMGTFLTQVQKRLSTANGKIVVDNADPGALVVIDGAEGGVGNVEQFVQRGSHTVKVTASGFKPFEKTVSVEPGADVTVQVTLEAIPLDPVAPVVVQQGPSQNVFTKPGLYLAIAGAAAIATGIAFGQSAQNVKTRVEAGGDPVGVTRAEAKDAPTHAILANVLVGAGAAAVAGGITWIIVTLPPPVPTSTGVKPTIEPTESATPTGAMLRFGGSF